MSSNFSNMIYNSLSINSLFHCLLVRYLLSQLRKKYDRAHSSFSRRKTLTFHLYNKKRNYSITIPWHQKRKPYYYSILLNNEGEEIHCIQFQSSLSFFQASFVSFRLFDYLIYTLYTVRFRSLALMRFTKNIAIFLFHFIHLFYYLFSILILRTV